MSTSGTVCLVQSTEMIIISCSIHLSTEQGIVPGSGIDSDT